MSDVFISYKREDLTAVNRLVESLRAEGVGVWWDQDIPPNAPWEATIEKELAAAKLVIVAWSPASVASDNVKAEARWARGRGRLLQVFVEVCEPPLFFGERQGVDLKGWSGGATDPAFRTLLQVVRAGPTPMPEETASEAPPAPLPLPSKPSIAVMPFANLSGDPEQDYFADGMVEEITTVLSRFKSIFVVGSGSTFTFKGRAAIPQEVGRALGVRYVLEGSVRKAGGRVRIAVKLTDAADGVQVWTERFEDTLEDVFALQDRVALGAAVVIEPAIVAAEVRRASMRPTENLSSYDLYLRALPLQQSFRPEKEQEAIVLLERAIELDPDFGRALSLAAWCHAFFIVFGGSDDPQSHRQRALQLARRAAAAGSDDAQALAFAANVLINLEAKPDTALPLIERAMVLNAGAEIVWMQAGILRLNMGEPELAIGHLETALRLDPLSPMRSGVRMFVGVALSMQGRFEEAYAVLNEIVQIVPSAVAPGALASVCGHLGRIEEAREALALYAKRSSVPVDRHVRGRPQHRKRFIDGIALARGETPASDPA